MSQNLPVLLIAAINKLGYIGKDGDLIIKCRRDLQRFKELSGNGVLIMGRKTYESLPKWLPGRSCVVVTTQPRTIKHPINAPVNGTVFVGSTASAIEAAERLAALKGHNRIVICGGAAIYKDLMNSADEIYLTEFDDETIGDAIFPINNFETALRDGRLVESEGEYNFYEGNMQVSFKNYQVAPLVEGFVGDMVKLRTGIRFRLCALDAVIPLEDSILLVINGGAFHITHDDAKPSQVLAELDALLNYKVNTDQFTETKLRA